MKIILTREGINNIICIQDSTEILPLISKENISLIILDLIMPGISGEEILYSVSENYPEIPVIIITAMDEVELAVRCMKKGAFDYFVKPIEKDKLLISVKRALRFRTLQIENKVLKDSISYKEISHPEAFAGIITRNEKMHILFKYVEGISATLQPVLIFGETGVGKELFAEAIHILSRRPGKFIKANIAGLDETLFSDTLFGHTKGSFTGALNNRAGLIEEARNGTLFFDEIGDLSHTSQVKLLRLLESKEYIPLGTDHPKKTNACFVAATNKDLKKLINEGGFRKDLYYRLCTHSVHIPSLKERMSDVPLLFDHFLSKAAAELQKKKPKVPKEVFTLLCMYDFPGNIRELRSMVYNALSLHKKGVLSASHFNFILKEHKNDYIEKDKNPFYLDNKDAEFIYQLPTLKEAENILISKAMFLAQNNQTIAAKILGISRQALNQRLQKQKNDEP